MKKKILHPNERIFNGRKMTSSTSATPKSFSKKEIAEEAINYLSNFPQYVPSEETFGGGDFGGGGSGGEY